MMTKAVWNGKVLAVSDRCMIVEGNFYFPPESINREFLKPSNTHSTCPWKGQASYCDVVVNGKVNKDAAWYYPEPNKEAHEIKNHVAFWKDVEIEE